MALEIRIPKGTQILSNDNDTVAVLADAYGEPFGPTFLSEGEEDLVASAKAQVFLDQAQEEIEEREDSAGIALSEFSDAFLKEISADIDPYENN
jgi:hypothetical protein